MNQFQDSQDSRIRNSDSPTKKSGKLIRGMNITQNLRNINSRISGPKIRNRNKSRRNNPESADPKRRMGFPKVRIQYQIKNETAKGYPSNLGFYQALKLQFHNFRNASFFSIFCFCKNTKKTKGNKNKRKQLTSKKINNPTKKNALQCWK